jgi:hypothetical protein
MPNQTSLEDFVKMAAFANAHDKDFPRMYRTFGIDEARWLAISVYWMGQLAGDPAGLGARFQKMMTEEVARLRNASAAD